MRDRTWNQIHCNYKSALLRKIITKSERILQDPRAIANAPGKEGVDMGPTFCRHGVCNLATQLAKLIINGLWYFLAVLTLCWSLTAPRCYNMYWLRAPASINL
jgi:hypothetical protein